VKIDDDPSLALDADNLQTVCARCHLKIHRERMEERDGM
jgi:predicted HNH restriction endonuclease